MRFFQRRYQENTRLLNICKYIADVCIVIVLAYVLVTFICCRSTVVGNSMEETLSNDNTVLINRISYAFNGPKRFDCIAFEQDSVDSSKIYIKRVIGLPGETVQIKDGRVYINDSQLDDFVDTSILTPGVAANPYKLADDEYFVLGDNRNNSDAIKKYAKIMIRRHIGINYSGTGQEVYTDGKWLAFMLEQILSNAIKYTPQGFVTIETAEEKDRFFITIKDTGIGIKAEDLPRVFEKGYTGYNGHADKKATGIGLYLCRQMADKLGHTIRMESEIGKGTKVWIGFDLDYADTRD